MKLLYSKPLRALFAFSLFFVISSGSLFSQALEAPVVSGKITLDQGVDPAGVQLMLLEFDPSRTDGPPMRPLMRGSLNADGTYEISGFEISEGAQYLVGVLVGEFRTSSDMFNFVTSTNQQVDIDIAQKMAEQGAPQASPEITGPFTDNPENIEFERISIVIVYYHDTRHLRITNFLAFRSTENLPINLEDNPLVMTQPSMNPRDLSNAALLSDSNLSVFDINEKDEILFYLYSPNPQGEMIYEFDSGPVGETLSFDYNIYKGLQEFEIIYPMDSMDADIDGFSTEGEVKNFGGIDYITKSVKFDGNTEKVRINISSMPLTTETTAIIAVAISLIPLLSMVIFFMYRNKKKSA